MDPKTGGLAMLQCYSDSEDESQPDMAEMSTAKESEGSTLPTNVSGYCNTRIHSRQMETIAAVHNCDSDSSVAGFNDGNCMIVEDVFTNHSITAYPHRLSDPELYIREAPADSIDTKDCTNLVPDKLPEIVNFPQPYRQIDSSDSDSDSSSDESIVSIPKRRVMDDMDENDNEHSGVTQNTKMLEDLGLLDLPPLEDLVISVPEAECIPIGKITNIIDILVLVMAKKGTPAVDLDSVLFLDNGKKTLGKVFDVFGQVNEPIYMVRFNSAEHIVELGIAIGMEVWFAPRTSHTAFVFVDALMRVKGSDASWEHDQEPPDGCIEYSDDEDERKAKAAARSRRAAARQGEDGETRLPQPKKQRQRRQHPSRSYDNRPSNPFYMQPQHPALQYYHTPPSQRNIMTNQPPPPPPSSYTDPPLGGPTQFPPPS